MRVAIFFACVAAAASSNDTVSTASNGTATCAQQYAEGETLITLQTAQAGDLAERRFLLYVPPGIPQGVQLPLIVLSHGYSASPYYVSLLTNITRYAEDYKWIVAAPFGTAQTNPPSYSWAKK